MQLTKILAAAVAATVALVGVADGSFAELATVEELEKLAKEAEELAAKAEQRLGHSLHHEVEQWAKDETACWKRVAFRGMGHLKNCTADEERQMGVCYKKCGDGSVGEGPFCFSECPADLNLSAGAICCKDKNVCTQKIVDLAVKIPWDIARAVMDQANPIKELKDLKKIIHDAAQAVFPECEK
ncbi:Uncharacterized protein SCF082_LOCUS22510 [Durusdinium trenchii]|uniref:Uncharacterized protein n=1 Tax=Durusdinium trenchii TaxID=1381693 RepID=A0ABP0LIR9_9DINO